MSRSSSGPVRALRVVAVSAALALVAASPAHARTPAAGPAPAAATPCPASDARAAADSYLASLTSHDASAVPFAPQVLRIENGLVTGRSADEIRQDLNTSWKYRIIAGLRDRVYTEGSVAADGTTGIDVHYVLDIGGPSFTLLSAGVQEHFDVRCEQITFIKATIGLP